MVQDHCGEGDGVYREGIIIKLSIIKLSIVDLCSNSVVTSSGY